MDLFIFHEYNSPELLYLNAITKEQIKFPECVEKMQFLL